MNIIKKKETKFRKILNIVLSLLIPLILLLLIEYGVASGKINGNLIPAPSKLIKTFIKLTSSGKLQSALLISFRRVLLGFFIGLVGGVVIGLIMGLVDFVNHSLIVIVNVLRPIPTIAIIPIFIVLFGIGEVSNVAVIVVGAFWPVLLNTISGILNVDKKLIELAYVYRIGNAKTLFKVVIPSASTSIMTGIRLALGTAWMSVVAAEMIGASSGIGYMIMYSRELAQTANMYIAVLTIGIIGFALDRILYVIQISVNKKFSGIVE